MDGVEPTMTNFSSCVKPFVIWMRLLGIELDDNLAWGKNYCRPPWLVPVIGLALLFSNLSISIFMVYYAFHYYSVGSSKTFSWNLVIDFSVTGLLSVGVHAALLAVTQQAQWKALWFHLQELYHIGESQSIHVRLRRAIFCSLAFILMETSMLFTFSFTLFKTSDLARLLHAIFSLFVSYGLSGLMLFAISGYVTILALSSLLDQVDGGLLKSETSMLRWKGRHVLICDCIDLINNCFGPILLFWIIQIFVNLISTSFYVVSPYARFEDLVLCGVQGIQQTIRLLILTLIPHHIYKQALKVGGRLRQLAAHGDHELQEQLDLLTNEVFLCLPKITAMDYCDVGLSLIPTLIGTTLTYLIILCQFQKSEIDPEN